jgi:diguanylate cyclase (GGDEF)-like protein
MPFRSQQDALEIELIRSLFETSWAAGLMTACFVLSGTLIVHETGDPVLLVLLVAGTLAALARLAVNRLSAGAATNPDISVAEARRLQRRFTVVYFAFAVVLGMFGSEVIRGPESPVHMLMVCLLVGYGAGVAASVGLRPRLAIPSMLVATIPAAVAAIAKADPVYWATCFLISAFLSGGVRSVRERHRRATLSIGRRLAFATLARRDHLTDLPNRLALREWFDERVAFAGEPGLVAVHYLDLDGFKPVNDSFGHPVGDELLAAVGRRIARTIRDTDMAARLGGDEFVVVQRAIGSSEDAAALAARLAEAIARPFRIGERQIAISTCIGYVTSDDRAFDLDVLIGMADHALYASKRGARGVVSYAETQRPAVREAA